MHGWLTSHLKINKEKGGTLNEILEPCLKGLSKDLIDREHLLANLTLAKVKPVNLAVSSSLGYLPKLKYSSLCAFSIF